jgi:three-Cys-motif partner protein
MQHHYQTDAELVCLFIEQDKDRLTNLSHEIAQLNASSAIPSNIKHYERCGRFDDTMAGLLDEVDAEGGLIAPTFAFIDPFGWSHTPMDIVKRLLSKPRCETLITLIYEELNRFATVELPNDQRDALFGTPDWSLVSQQSTPETRRAYLRDLYERQLRNYAGAKYVRSFEMRNRHNSTDLFLFFATNSKIGLQKMKEAMWKVDPSGSYLFSDVTNPCQPTLFTPGPDYRQVRSLIVGRFGGRSANIQAIEDYLIEDTPFLSSHFRRHVLAAMERESPPGIRVISSPRSRRGVYPKGTIIEFA